MNIGDSPFSARFKGAVSWMTANGLGSLARLGIVMLLLVNAAMLVYYICVGYAGFFHSDSAAKNLLAQEVFETGRLFPQDWNYVNGDLMVVFGHLFILPLLAFAGNGFHLHAVSGLLSAPLILLGAWLLSGVADRGPWTRIAMLVVMSGGISAFMAENLYGQVSYGHVFYMACFLAYFVWRALQAQQRRGRYAWSGAVFSMVLLMFWSNPQRSVATYVAPALGAISVWWWGREESAPEAGSPTLAALRVVAAIAVGAAIGFALHVAVLQGVNNSQGAGAARWLSFEGMRENAWNTLLGLLALLGAVPQAGGTVLDAQGLYDAARLSLMGLLLAALPAALVMSMLRPEPGTRFVGGFAVTSLALVLFLQITTTIPDMRDPVTSSRYMAPGLLLAIMVFTSLGLACPKWHAKALTVAILVMLATSPFSPRHPFSLLFARAPADPRLAWMAALREAGLHYGYATYWRANAITVLSNQQLRIRPVVIEGGLPMPMRHLSSNRWYRPSAYRGASFLLLDNEEAQAVDWRRLHQLAGEPIRVIDIAPYKAYVFGTNLASALPRWDNRISGPIKIPLTGASPRQIGIMGTVDGRACLVADRGQSGYLHFGPYLQVQRGRFQAAFDVAIERGPGPGLDVDVVSEQGKHVLAATQKHDAGSHHIELDFTVDQPVADLELRVRTNGASRVALCGLSIRPERPAGAQ